MISETTGRLRRTGAAIRRILGIDREPDVERRRVVRRKSDDRKITAALTLSLICTLVVVVGSCSVARNTRDVLTLKEGRQIGVSTTCPLIVAVIDAGGTIISGGDSAGLLPGDRLEGRRFVAGPLTELLGDSFPDYEGRKQLANTAAEAYRKKIADKLAESLREADVDNPPVDGSSISCKKYAVVVKAR